MGHHAPDGIQCGLDGTLGFSEDLNHAMSARQRVREKMTTAFADGYRITNFDVASSVYGLCIP